MQAFSKLATVYQTGRFQIRLSIVIISVIKMGRKKSFPNTTYTIPSLTLGSVFL